MFNFCYFCGGKLTRHRTHFSCTKCHKLIYLNPLPCTNAILVNEQGQILLTKRKFKPNKGFWQTPGGFMEVGETAEEAIQRELKEELNIQVDNLKYTCSQLNQYFYQGAYRKQIVFYFQGQIPSDLPIKPLDDVASIKFFDPTDLPFHHLSAKSELNALKQFLKS